MGIEIIESESLDISSDYIEFLSETALVAKKIVDCKPLRAFFQSKKFLQISAIELLQCEDFFMKYREHEITTLLIDYHSKYGVPVWTFFTKSKFFVDEVPMPEEWNGVTLKNKVDDWIAEKFRKSSDETRDLTDVILQILDSAVYPFAFSLAFFVDFYRSFIVEDLEEGIALGEHTSLGIHILTKFCLQEDHSRVICLEAYEVENVAYASAIALMMNNGGLRFCKCCGKMFVADRPRAEYCSPRCRNQYNTRMSRLRKRTDV